MTTNPFIDSANQVFATELAAIEEVQQFVDQQFVKACEIMFGCQGRIIVIGMGKSGHIGNKIAATLASTGSPAFFVHPGEASHGDLGMITKDDVVLMISNSGETQEVISILPVIKRLGAPVISMTGNPSSTMARNATVHLCVKVSKEACPLGLAPTASTTATLVMGDALAVALLEARGFTADDFALSHPGGSLGRRLLLTVADVMHQGDAIPMVKSHCTVKEALFEMSAKSLGMTAIVDESSQLQGIFTDGDLRRIIEQKIDIHTTPITQVMTAKSTTARADMLAAEVLNIMETKRINGLIVVNENNIPVGALNTQDLLRAGVL
ncbi:KpsF/GutQ family sugar-phosphate isomerase [Pseudoalteromonas piscicida]|uniref:Arabinose 5-phosphate isomerase n=1 Tax=Pseudoalteromonas piscicida TaxID=43662 RepID=A0AAQ2ITA1_PSEO7|nr:MULTISPECIES: KpsF/GutQ family sugar-phosphate isomerase [Pseudoalteromonas]KJY87449.1 D-arabinose 5-phosphate isomerase [Pseudoalteromonas piscicida]TMN41355.1 KpsF/GutQ family sugar-phosphate isomerase [Pseudoalteromonas piscicida]TMN43281.1 KpsF/GutQ family sugar-phosphate isomerase [Pseudoalteromonas piscicida]TMN47170.1 KpsF/GutQ family sugar-phosphate isomerase [Pseudoalteromonas piscicida]TMN48343.1 KpsF/GutQ family sugar-phosphate isomerase [Pseudoalteromonas piscicida]